jgi:2-keto-4-pentenoate hydratase/2-oxohepta-3-ene-1,7-dioic acid hydratase in catechol pathway
MKLTINNKEFYAPLRTIWCLGRNYAKHAQELGNEVETKPLVFQKGLNAMQLFQKEISLPWHLGQIHYETELVYLVERKEDELRLIAYTLGLDLTLRDLQTSLKQKGKPWTLAKSFDGAGIIGEFIPLENIDENIEFTLSINDDIRQKGQSKNMILSPPKIVDYLNKYTDLQTGDLIFTGTPEGVGRLKPNDIIELKVGDIEIAKSVLSE